MINIDWLLCTRTVPDAAGGAQMNHRVDYASEELRIMIGEIKCIFKQ